MPRSLLILNQSTSLRPWPTAVIAGIQSSMQADPVGTITYHVEHLDFYQLDSARYRDSLPTWLAEKYRDMPIGVVVAIGPKALDVALQLHASAWPRIPVVFAAVDEDTAARPLPPGVTGHAVRMTLASMMRAAQAVVPGLKRVALVGNRFAEQPYYRHFADELPGFAARFEFIDLMGLPIDDVRRRIAGLPDDSVILYVGINSDPQRTFVSAAEALPLIAQGATRPIVVDVETFLGLGAVGGFVLSPAQIGRDAGRLAQRLLAGESASDMPVTAGDTLKPIFDWRELQRWNVSEAALPAGSEIRFRTPGLWEQYRVQIIVTVAVIVLQAALIALLLYEDRRRRAAEALARRSLSEMAHMNRLAVAGELSASIAHEMNQPLTSIVANADAGMLWLAAATPNLEEARTSFKQITESGHHAAEVIRHIRAFFKKDVSENVLLDLNDLVRAVLAMAAIELQEHNVVVETALQESLPAARGDRVELMQVILNLIVNAGEAMEAVTDRRRMLRVRSQQADRDSVLVQVEDSGAGIDPADLERVFEPFYTTKAKGVGMGLALSRSLVEAHHGRLWAAPAGKFGTVFSFTLPVAASGARDARKSSQAVELSVHST